MCPEVIILLSIFSFSNYFIAFMLLCASLLCVIYKNTLTKLNFRPPLSIIEKQIKAILLLHARHKNIYFLSPNCCEVQHTMHLLQLPQEFGLTQCKQTITGRVFSGNLQKLFVSVQRLQRVWFLSERAGGWQKARKGWFPTQSERLDLLKAVQTHNVVNWFTYHTYVNAVYPPLRVWFSI